MNQNAITIKGSLVFNNYSAPNLMNLLSFVYCEIKIICRWFLVSKVKKISILII